MSIGDSWLRGTVALPNYWLRGTVALTNYWLRETVALTNTRVGAPVFTSPASPWDGK